MSDANMNLYSPVTLSSSLISSPPTCRNVTIPMIPKGHIPPSYQKGFNIALALTTPQECPGFIDTIPSCRGDKMCELGYKDAFTQCCQPTQRILSGCEIGSFRGFCELPSPPSPHNK